MELLARSTGWLATLAIVLAALVPLVHRARQGKRAAPRSPSVRLHVTIGFATSALAFGHTFAALPSLGSPAATGGGMAALLPAGSAFFLLVAHAGLGLQLRDPRLKERARKRRAHTMTALSIAVAVTVHVVALARAR